MNDINIQRLQELSTAITNLHNQRLQSLSTDVAINNENDVTPTISRLASMRIRMPINNNVEESDSESDDSSNSDGDLEIRRLPTRRMPINNHIEESESDDNDSDEDSDDELINEKKCPICLDIIYIYDRCYTKCLHEFHTSCLLKIKKNECPLCRLPITQYDEAEDDDVEDDEAINRNNYIPTFVEFRTLFPNGVGQVYNRNDESTQSHQTNESTQLPQPGSRLQLTIRSLSFIINRLSELIVSNNDIFDMIPKMLLIMLLFTILLISLTPMLLIVLILIALYK